MKNVNFKVGLFRVWVVMSISWIFYNFYLFFIKIGNFGSFWRTLSSDKTILPLNIEELKVEECNQELCVEYNGISLNILLKKGEDYQESWHEIIDDIEDVFEHLNMLREQYRHDILDLLLSSLGIPFVFLSSFFIFIWMAKGFYKTVK